MTGDVDIRVPTPGDQGSVVSLLGRLPESPEELQTVAELAAGGMTQEIEALTALLESGMYDVELRTLFRGLEDAAGEALLVGLSVRSRNLLSRLIKQERSLLTMTPSDLCAVPNLGRKSFHEIIDAVVRTWAKRLLSGPPPQAAWTAGPSPPTAPFAPHGHDVPAADGSTPISWMRVLPDIELVLHAMWRQLGATTPGEAIAWWEAAEISELANGAYERLRELDIGKILGLPPTEERAWASLLDFGTEDRQIMEERMFVGLDRKRLTLDELARLQGVTRERIRQREDRISKKLAERLDSDDPGQAIGHLAAATRRHVGPITSPAAWRSAFQRAVEATSDADRTDRDFRVNLLSKLAGDYVLDGDVVMTSEARDRVKGLRKELDSGLVDQTIDASEVTDILTDLGAPAELSATVSERLGLRRFGENFIRWRRTAGDRAVAVLAATGRPMEFDELHDAVGFETNPRSLSNTVQSDPRCQRLGKSLYGLRSWGGIEYRGILSAIEDAIEEAGGRAQLDEIAREISERFAVSPTSVHAYAKDRRFQLEPDGAVSMAPEDSMDAVPDVPPPEFVRGLYRLDGIWHARVDVDPELLRGSGRPIRPAVAVAADLEPGLVFGCDYGDETVVFSWTGRSPIVGKLRPLALAAGCVDGDTLFIALAGDEPRSFRRLARDRRSSAHGLERVALEMGITVPVSEQEIDPVTAAVGLPAGADGVDLADRLRARREDELVAMLPEHWQ